jgi:hypothetical protein
MVNTIQQFLQDRGVPADAIQELVALLPRKMAEASCSYFYTAKHIMHPDKWFYWPGQTRFVLVGQCPNGDGIGIDTKVHPGAIFFISHEHLDVDAKDEDVTVQVAASPADYARKIQMGNEDCPMDFWEAKRS